MAINLEFQEVFKSLDRMGFTDVVLPFLLIFTVIFAVLDKTKILGEAKRNLNMDQLLIGLQNNG